MEKGRYRGGKKYLNMVGRLGPEIGMDLGHVELLGDSPGLLKPLPEVPGHRSPPCPEAWPVPAPQSLPHIGAGIDPLPPWGWGWGGK